MKELKALVALALMFGSVAYGADVFVNSEFGFSVEQPQGWHFISTEDVMKSRAQVTLEDQNVEKKIQAKETAPTLSFSKYPSSHPNFNPYLQIGALQIDKVDGLTRQMFADLLLEQNKRIFKDFRVIARDDNSSMGGEEASYLKSSFTMATKDGQEKSVLNESIIIFREKSIFMFSMSGAINGKDNVEDEFMKARNTVRFLTPRLPIKD